MGLLYIGYKREHRFIEKIARIYRDTHEMIVSEIHTPFQE